MFPARLLDALLSSEVVFVCGAGVSAPQLVDFEGLVAKLYERFDLPRTPGETRAFKVGRFEEVLGSLARRLVDPSQLYREAANLLTLPASPDLSRHNLLLRLSRDLSNRVSLITTNFDALFEHAAAAHGEALAAAKLSIAGQALPAPGAEDFAGVIHLHGRLADPILGLEATPLVLTSAEYGDAYMRSGWASRFLFDLARCKTLVLVGYSANDAPIRYFLNVLEADRERFTDLKPIYALDGYDDDPAEVEGRWSTLAVEPLAFRKTVPGREPFGVLWDDLGELADLVERPRPNRQRQIVDILKEPFDRSPPTSLSALDWLQRGRGDLWDRIMATVEDPAWFDHFSKTGLWLPKDPEWFLPIWFARDWTSSARLLAAVRWLKTPNVEIARRIEQELSRRPPSDTAWRRAWHVLAQATLRRAASPMITDHELAAKLRNADVFDLDLQEGIAALTPMVVIEPPFPISDREDDTPRRHLRQFYDITVGRRTTDQEHAEVMAVLIGRRQDVRRIAEIATDALRASLAVAADLGLIKPWDELDYGLPSVADHDQNEFHGGVLPLVRLLAGVLPELAQQDREFARHISRSWATVTSRVGRRLWLHALSDPTLYSIDEVVDGVLALSEDDFWAQRRELPVLFLTRFAEASDAQRQAIVERIRTEGPLQFPDSDAHPDETDWRPAARDHAMWLRLTALRQAGALTLDGEEQLEELRGAHPFLRRNLEDQDFFSSYMSGIRSVEGDPSPLAEAEPDERLNIAHRLIEGRDFEHRHGWAAFCRTQPNEAFDTLNKHGFRQEDGLLWRDLLNSVWHPTPGTEQALAQRARLLDRIFVALGSVPINQIKPLLDSLTDAFRAAQFPARLRAQWWDRLWQAASETVEAANPEPLTAKRFYDDVINNPAGKLAEELLKWIDAQNKDEGHVSGANWQRLRRIWRSETTAGQFARGACARAVPFLVYLNEGFVTRWVVPRLEGDDDRAMTLRSVFAQWSSPSAQASRLLKPIILRCAREATGQEDNCHPIATKILLPLIRHRLTGGLEDWGFSDADTRRALKDGTDAFRVAAARVLAQWHRAKDIDTSELWMKATKPVFQTVWPIEKRLKTPAISRHLAALCTLTGTAFPDAVQVLGPYLTIGERQDGGFYFLWDTPIAGQFPKEMLELLWLLLRGCEDRFTTPEIAKALDAIKAAEPGLETDRRFQWLETKATRYG